MTQNSATELIVIRHARTQWNSERRMQGQLNSDLDAEGHRQAQALGERMAGERFAALYSSDAPRAMQTAEYVARATGHDIIPDPRLRERHLGVFQGLSFEEARKKYPKEFERFTSRDPDYVMPGGESRRQAQQRSVAVLEDLSVRHPGECIVVVTHGGVAISLFRHALHLPVQAKTRFSNHNTGLSRFIVENGTWKLDAWGDICHLRALDGNRERKSF